MIQAINRNRASLPSSSQSGPDQRSSSINDREDKNPSDIVA